MLDSLREVRVTAAARMMASTTAMVMRWNLRRVGTNDFVRDTPGLLDNLVRSLCDAGHEKH